MQTKIILTLAMGFLFGLGLASCASVESHRSVASDSPPRYMTAQDVNHDKVECQVGEERNASGDCQRPHTFDHPFRRGGR